MSDAILRRVTASRPTFFGWRVVAAASVLAAFGWGVGFYGPPVYLHTVREARGWPLGLVSAAVTAHFLVGALAVANLPRLHRRFGVAATTKGGAVMLGLGVCGWAIAAAPWQLFAASVLSGAGWVTMGAAGVNAVVSPWFVRRRPAALAMAYNGASIGGAVFSPLWVAAIASLGFPVAAAVIAASMALVVWLLADRYFAKTPQALGLAADGDEPGTPPVAVTSPLARPLPGGLLWRDWRFFTLAAAMALGLFAQIGIIAHLFSLLVPSLGAQQAGFATGLATASAIAGRTLVGRLMPLGADRRLFACASCVVQISGVLAFIAASGESVPLLLLGVVLFGAGIGNGTSLPPLIAQVEFVKDDVPRVVALIVAIAQAGYAFAPAAFALLRDADQAAAPLFFAMAALVQMLAILAFLAGRRGA